MHRRNVAGTVLAAVLVVSLLPFLSVSGGVEGKEDVKVIAYYYIWWGLPEPYVNHWLEKKSNYTPALGYYSSGDPQIAGEHVRVAKQNGIGGFAVSWLGVSSWFDHRAIDENLRNGLLKADLTGFEFCLFYETELSMNATRNLFALEDSGYDDWTEYFQDIFLDDVDYAASTYFGNAHYTRIDGKPVFIVYNVPSLCANLTTQGANEFLSNLRQRLNQSVYLVGDLWLGKSSPLDVENDPCWEGLDWTLFDAVTSYLYSYPGAGWDALVANATENFPKLIEYFEAKGIRYFPNAYPGYKDRDAEADDMTLSVSPTEFGEMLEVVFSSVSSSDVDAKVVMITSYNEWLEATAIEPSVEIEDVLLKQVLNAAARQDEDFTLATVLLISTAFAAIIGVGVYYRKRKRT